MNLYHGTKADNIEEICEYNFDWRLSGSNKGTLLGYGVYFSKHAWKSDYFTTYKSSDKSVKYMFVAHVIVGKICVGNKDYKRPPKYSAYSNEYYDSCVDNLNNPLVYAIFDSNRVYPAYLITYS